MVERNYFRVLSNEEASRYKFGFCKNCPFYECELVGEYSQFRENHAKDQKPQELPIYDKYRAYRCTVTLTGIWSKEEYDKLDAGSGSSNAYSHSFDADAVSYDPKLKDGCFMSCRYVYQVECGKKTVTEGIGDHYKIDTDYDCKIKKNTEDRWEPSQPVFISAQTGQGKNYFIENTLISYVRELNLKHQTEQKVLILSNRLALKAQIKNRLDGNDDSHEEQEKYSFNEYADVMTYQGMLLYKKKLEEKQKYAKSRYIFVICDEAHFFASDAMFNPHTQRILQTIVQVFKDAVRIYMSATPYECLKYIIENEREYYKPLKRYSSKMMVFYHFKRDYSYLDVKTYSSIRELYEEIIESVNKRKEKWLIFIDDKRKCVSVKDQLEKHAEAMKSPLVVENDKRKDNKSKRTVEKVYVVDANSKKKTIYQEIVKNERLNKDTYVLITTSVLDNGVNLKGIKNIVVSDMTKAKCLQMVGRARVERNDDRKKLYIKRFSDDEVGKRITDLMKQQDAYGKYEIAYKYEQPNRCFETYDFFKTYYNGREEDWQNAKRWFGRTIETELYLNKIAKSLLEELLPYYQSIYDEMIDEKAKEDNAQDSKCISHIGQKYLEYQLSWFGKKYCEDDDITFADKEKAKKELLAFLEPYAEKGTRIVTGEEMNEFSREFIKLFDAAYGKSDRNSREYGAKKINKLLEEQSIGYNINGKPQAGPWTVVRVDRLSK